MIEREIGHSEILRVEEKKRETVRKSRRAKEDWREREGQASGRSYCF